MRSCLLYGLYALLIAATVGQPLQANEDKAANAEAAKEEGARVTRQAYPFSGLYNGIGGYGGISNYGGLSGIGGYGGIGGIGGYGGYGGIGGIGGYGVGGLRYPYYNSPYGGLYGRSYGYGIGGYPSYGYGATAGGYYGSLGVPFV